MRQLLLLPPGRTRFFEQLPLAAREGIRNALIVFGVLMVVWGSLDALSHLPTPQIDDATLREALAPGILLESR
jgi:hypothetical protein